MQIETRQIPRTLSLQLVWIELMAYQLCAVGSEAGTPDARGDEPSCGSEKGPLYLNQMK
jgi:hypothetical protein